MLTSKENVKRAIHFQNPEYIPLQYFDLNYAEKSDIIMNNVQVVYGGEDGHTSEWGWKMNPIPPGMILGTLKEPALKEWEDIANYKPLDPHRPGRFDELLPWIDKYPDKYHIANFRLTGFTAMWHIRGFEEFLMDLLLEREYVEQLADIVFSVEEELMTECAKQGFDCVRIADDWGSETSLLISKDLINEIFIPRYKHQHEHAKKLGIDILFHSCGYVYDIVDDLINKGGIHLFNPGQPTLCGVERLGKEFGGKTCFITPVDYQHTSVFGTPEQIEAELLSYINSFNRPNGGFIGMVFKEEELIEFGATPERARFVTEVHEKYCGRSSVK